MIGLAETEVVPRGRSRLITARRLSLARGNRSTLCQQSPTPPVEPRSNTHEEWTKIQAAYWDSIASGYDSQYLNAWSRYENALVQRRLLNILRHVPATPEIVEFGCGTGLGYNLVSAHSDQIKYTGIDVSPVMLDVFRRRIHDGVDLLNYPMESMSPGRFADLDLAFAIFTSASYVDMELEALLSLLRGWLKPHTGVMYISFLNRLSLSNIVTCGFRSRIRYSSRGIRTGVTVPARRYSKAELLRASRSLGLKGNVCSLGPLVGILEKPILQGVNSALLGLSLPAHTIDLVARRIS
jgi:SAM-dependent methyltransferase